MPTNEVVLTDTIDDAAFAAVAAIVREAGELTMRHFRRGSRIAGRVDWKTGGSPVTEVDLAVDTFLRTRLPTVFPDAGWLSEETADTPARLGRETVFVVDPIDGTRGFMEGDPRFAVSVALVVGGRPVAAVVDAPALDQIFTARAGQGAFLNGAPIRASSHAGLEKARLVGPKFLTEPVARELGMAPQPKTPSLALRFSQTAAGMFEVAIASTNSHDWDIAAADLILHEAGATLRDLDGRELVYNRPEVKHGILVAAPDRMSAPVRDALNDITDNGHNNRGKA